MNAKEQNMSRRDEMEALLPFYLNGTLEGDDLRAVEEWLAGDAEAMSALAEAEMEHSETSVANEAIRVPADALSRFSRSLEQEPGSRRMADTTWIAALWQRVVGLPAGLAWAMAAVAVALVLVQAVTDATVDRSGYEIAGTPDDAETRPSALVVFSPEARMADIAAFLQDNGATIVSGPAAGGVFRIAISADTAAEYDRIVALVAAQPFAQSVTPGRRPAEGE
jgi:anti-sigma-K factor RskA